MSTPTTVVEPSAPLDAPSAEDLEALVLQTWGSYLAGAAPVIPSQAHPYHREVETAADDDVAWSATVGFEGRWRGLVALELDATTAENATRELLAMDAEEELTDEDVADAVGELVNILGGSVKSSVAASGSLSLPVVAAGRVALPRASRRLAEVVVHWHGRPVRVHLHVTTRADAPAETPREQT